MISPVAAGFYWTPLTGPSRGRAASPGGWGRCLIIKRQMRRLQASLVAYQLSRKTRRRSRSTLARPYIWRLRNFKRLTWPSVWPLLQGSVKAARTADKSARRLLAKLFISCASQR
jgi:hypothetical protein